MKSNMKQPQIQSFLDKSLKIYKSDYIFGRKAIRTAEPLTKLRRKLIKLSFIRMQKQTHVVIHKTKFSSHYDIIFQLDIYSAFMLYEASKIRKEKVLNNRQSTDFSIDCAMLYKSFDILLQSTMIAQEATIFPKQIKLDDYSQFSEDNVVRIVETSNLLVGSGARTSNAAIMLAKALHYLHEQNVMSLTGTNILDLGCGTGLLGVYLCCLGANTFLADVPSVRDLAERNISLNKNLLKGKSEFISVNWKRQQCVGKCEQMNCQSSTSSEQREECLLHLVPKIDYTIVCDCGGLTDLKYQLRWMGRQGMIVCFLERQFGNAEDFLDSRAFEQYLLEIELNYQKIDSYHPDYLDERVKIYRLWK